MPPKKTTTTTPATKASTNPTKRKPAAPRSLQAVADEPVRDVDDAAAAPDASDASGGWSLPIPLTGWRLGLPRVPDSITVPIVHLEITAPERESAAYYLVLGGLVAVEILDWPLALLLATGHLLAKQHRYRALEGAVEALEVG